MWGLPSVTHSRFRRTAALLDRAAHGPVSLRKQQPQNCRNLTLSCGLFWSGGVARFGVDGCNFNTNLLQIRCRFAADCTNRDNRFTSRLFAKPTQAGLSRSPMRS